jgi:hypothetical protein
MIGRLTHGVIMSDEDAEDVHAYAQVGLRVMQERNKHHKIARGLLALDQIILEMHRHETRALVPIVSESASSIDDLPERVTVRQAEPFLPWGMEHIRRLIRTGQIPILEARPYMLAREVVRVLSTQPPRSNRSKHAGDEPAKRSGSWRSVKGYSVHGRTVRVSHPATPPRKPIFTSSNTNGCSLIEAWRPPRRSRRRAGGLN